MAAENATPPTVAAIQKRIKEAQELSDAAEAAKDQSKVAEAATALVGAAKDYETFAADLAEREQAAKALQNEIGRLADVVAGRRRRPASIAEQTFSRRSRTTAIDGDAILAVLQRHDGPQLAKTIAAEIGTETGPKLTAALKALTEDGRIVRSGQSTGTRYRLA